MVKQGKNSSPAAEREKICDEKFFKHTHTRHPSVGYFSVSHTENGTVTVGS